MRAGAADDPRRRLRDRGGMAGAPRVARLYVVSMLQPKVVRTCACTTSATRRSRSTRPSRPSPPDGQPIFFFNDDKPRASIAPVSRSDADAYPEFEALLERMAEFLRPMMLRPPPALGSKRPGDLFALLREAGRAAGMGRGGARALPRDDDVRRRPARRVVRDRRDQGRAGLHRRGGGLGRPAHSRHRLQPAAPRARRAGRRRRAVGARARRDGRHLAGDRGQRRGRRGGNPHRRHRKLDQRERRPDDGRDAGAGECAPRWSPPARTPARQYWS